jgi:glycosyltransferase involved in cell wall biosynthesis
MLACDRDVRTGRFPGVKILFDHPDPFLLMHGGFQIQIEQTMDALQKSGVEVEYLRWWDAAQQCDILHYFGRPRTAYVKFAQQKGMKVVMSQLLTGLGSRPGWKRSVQRLVIRASQAMLPSMVIAPFAWEAYRCVDASISLTPWEAQLMRDMFQVPAERVHVVPNGVEETFLQSRPSERGPWLVCTATITERKRVVELAEAAIAAQAPVWVVGKAYAESDAYAKRFLELVRREPKWIRYEGPVTDRNKLAQIYRAARGFVLLSTMESLSLSALEAAACECPLLLSDLPWARTVFQDGATYCPVTETVSRTAAVLRKFHDAAPKLAPPPKPLTWAHVAGQLKSVYAGVLKTSR